MTRLPLLLFSALACGAALLPFGAASLMIPAWLCWTVAAVAGVLALHELAGRPIPYLRWSFLRMLLGVEAPEHM